MNNKLYVNFAKAYLIVLISFGTILGTVREKTVFLVTISKLTKALYLIIFY